MTEQPAERAEDIKVQEIEEERHLTEDLHEAAEDARPDSESAQQNQIDPERDQEEEDADGSRQAEAMMASLTPEEREAVKNGDTAAIQKMMAAKMNGGQA